MLSGLHFFLFLSSLSVSSSKVVQVHRHGKEIRIYNFSTTGHQHVDRRHKPGNLHTSFCIIVASTTSHAGIGIQSRSLHLSKFTAQLTTLTGYDSNLASEPVQARNGLEQDRIHAYSTTFIPTQTVNLAAGGFCQRSSWLGRYHLRRRFGFTPTLCSPCALFLMFWWPRGRRYSRRVFRIMGSNGEHADTNMSATDWRW